MPRSSLALFACLALLGSACGNDENPPVSPKPSVAPQETPATPVQRERAAERGRLKSLLDRYDLYSLKAGSYGFRLGLKDTAHEGYYEARLPHPRLEEGLCATRKMLVESSTPVSVYGTMSDSGKVNYLRLVCRLPADSAQRKLVEQAASSEPELAELVLRASK